MPPVRLEDLILNDMYVAEELQQQDQYVDARSTMGMDMSVGSHVQNRLDAMQQQQGLVDNSLSFIPGTKLGDMARRLGGLGQVGKNIADKPLRHSLIDSDRGTNFRNWANGSETKILTRGDKKYYDDMSPSSSTLSKHNIGAKYFSDNVVEPRNYAGRRTGANMTQVHGKLDNLLDWGKRKDIKIPKEIVDKYSKYGVKNGMNLKSAEALHKDTYTNIMRDMGYSGIRDGRQIGYIVDDAYKSVMNSGQFGNNGNIMRGVGLSALAGGLGNNFEE